MGVDGGLSHLVGEVGKGISQPQSENNSQNPWQKLNCTHVAYFLNSELTELSLKFFCCRSKTSISSLMASWMLIFSNSSKFIFETPQLRMVRILTWTVDRDHCRVLQICGSDIFLIQRSLASSFKSILTEFHLTSTVLIASGGSTTCTSPAPTNSRDDHPVRPKNCLRSFIKNTF